MSCDGQLEGWGGAVWIVVLVTVVVGMRAMESLLHLGRWRWFEKSDLAHRTLAVVARLGLQTTMWWYSRRTIDSCVALLLLLLLLLEGFVAVSHQCRE